MSEHDCEIDESDIELIIKRQGKSLCEKALGKRLHQEDTCIPVTGPSDAHMKELAQIQGDGYCYHVLGLMGHNQLFCQDNVDHTIAPMRGDIHLTELPISDIIQSNSTQICSITSVSNFARMDDTVAIDFKLCILILIVLMMYVKSLLSGLYKGFKHGNPQKVSTPTIITKNRGRSRSASKRD